MSSNQDIIPKLERSKERKPVWDKLRRELRFDGELVKRFKWPAENQMRVLDAFQEQGWPSHIQDPLLPPVLNAKQRLQDTLFCLNARHPVNVIRFRGDGTGKGVRLEIVPEKFRHNRQKSDYTQ